MIEMLMDCHEREMLNQPPSKNYITRTAKGLLKRGLVVDIMYYDSEKEKKYLAFKLTEQGKSFLKNYTNQN